MRCMACGAEMILTNVVQDETMAVPGFEHQTFMCSECQDVERRLVFIKHDRDADTDPMPEQAAPPVVPASAAQDEHVAASGLFTRPLEPAQTVPVEPTQKAPEELTRTAPVQATVQVETTETVPVEPSIQNPRRVERRHHHVLRPSHAAGNDGRVRRLRRCRAEPRRDLPVLEISRPRRGTRRSLLSLFPR